MNILWVRAGVPLFDAFDVEVTRDEAVAEIDRHDVEGGVPAFLAEVGDRPRYLGAEVLGWLGY